MTNLSVKEKKAVIQKLADAYQNTGLHATQRNEILGGIEARLAHPQAVWQRPAILSAATFVLLLVATGVWWKTAQASETLAALAVNVKGSVTIEGQPLLNSSAVLREGTQLQTQQDSALQLELGKHKINVAGNSRLRLKSLKKRRLSFGVDKGKSHFAVAKLQKEESLQVHSGEVLVEVVGTQFSVFNNKGCVTVDVQEGRVKTTYRRKVHFVNGGRARRFCHGTVTPVESAALSLHSPVQDAQGMANRNTAQNKFDTDGSAPALGIDSPNPDDKNAGGSTHESLSAQIMGESGNPLGEMSPLHKDEVLLFDNAHKALTKGALPAAKMLFEKYKREYPTGLFAEDAQFRLVRIGFRQKQNTDVLNASSKFLQAFPGAGHRVTEVRILRAQTLISINAHAEALAALAPLLGSLTKHSKRHQHQITYLQFAVACAVGQTATCSEWAAQYAQVYPKGAFIHQAKKYAK